MPRYLRPLLLIGIVIAAGAIAALVLSPSSAPSETETEALLRDLPYRFHFHPAQTPPGAEGAVAGTVSGPHHTVVRFGVSLGEGGDPVPIRGALSEATGGAEFRVSNDTMVRDAAQGIAANPRYRTRAQWLTAAPIVTDIEEKLCRATTGKPCAI